MNLNPQIIALRGIFKKWQNQEGFTLGIQSDGPKISGSWGEWPFLKVLEPENLSSTPWISLKCWQINISMIGLWDVSGIKILPCNCKDLNLDPKDSHKKGWNGAHWQLHCERNEQRHRGHCNSQLNQCCLLVNKHQVQWETVSAINKIDVYCKIH